LTFFFFCLKKFRHYFLILKMEQKKDDDKNLEKTKKPNNLKYFFLGLGAGLVAVLLVSGMYFKIIFDLEKKHEKLIDEKIAIIEKLTKQTSAKTILQIMENKNFDLIKIRDFNFLEYLWNKNNCNKMQTCEIENSYGEILFTKNGYSIKISSK